MTTDAPMTTEEMARFNREQRLREQAVQDRARAALAPWSESREMMSDSQWFAVEQFMRALFEQADYFNRRNVQSVEVKLERHRAARPGSPRDRWSVTAKVATDHQAFYASGWCSIGKRGSLTGRVWDLLGSEKTFGKVRSYRTPEGEEGGVGGLTPPSHSGTLFP